MQRFQSDEEGAVFLEFLIVLYAWMFVLFGVIQVGLIVIASFYVNYANFMALRTAAVHYELYEATWESKSKFDNTCRDAAVAALAPIERFYWKNPYSGFMSWINAQNRTTFTWRTTGGSPPTIIEGSLSYRFFLVVPFVNRVIAAFDPTGSDLDPPNRDRNMENFASDNTPWGKYPTLNLRSNNSVDNQTGTPPLFHQMIIQRRWRYN